MPRKSKDELKIINDEILEATKNSGKSKTSTNSIKKRTNSSKNKSAVKKSNSTTTKKSSSKNNGTNATAKKNANNSKKKSTTTKKKNTSTDKVNKKELLANIEYYDLPYRYNETTVKILAQTPNMLFIYWDISDDDRSSYKEKYGEDFFEHTKPVLIVTNKTMNYSFEVEINDFANCWYLHVNDADCDYSVELGRRPIYINSNIDNYIHVSSSNDMEMPNNHILFDKLGKSVFFKNVKNNFIEEKEISSLSFIKNLGKIYDIYEIYKEIYKDEINIEELNRNNIKLNLSSSNSSTFK